MIQILIGAEVILGFLLAVDYLSWRNQTNYRRLERRAKINLERMSGR